MRDSEIDIKLRPLKKEDLELKVRWINDPDVHNNLHYEIPLILSKTKKWFQNAAADNTRRDFIIETTDGQPIGLIGLLHIDIHDRTAEFYIAIGEKTFWSKGIGTKSLLLLLRLAFEELNLHKIWATARTTNQASISMMKKVGFRQEGFLREEKVVKGQRVDIVRMGLLRTEFTC